MRRMAWVLGLTFAAGIAVGAIGDRVLHARQKPLKRAILLKTDLAGIAGRRAVLALAEMGAGAKLEKHHHPGPEINYMLEGSLVLHMEGKPPVTLRAGEASYIPAKRAHYAVNASKANPAKALVFYILEKGRPIALPSK